MNLNKFLTKVSEVDKQTTLSIDNGIITFIVVLFVILIFGAIAVAQDQKSKKSS